MNKYTYTVQTYYLDKWLDIVYDTRDFCLGFLHARRDQGPRNAYRLIRSDGKIMEEIPAEPDVFIGMVAGWPTPEQYEEAAQRALDKASKIREQTRRQEVMRLERQAKREQTNPYT